MDPLPLNQSLGKFKIKTPGIYTPSPWTFVGPFTWIVGTLSFIFGGGLTMVVYMGMGIGTFSLNWAFGIDFGIDAMGGISLPIYISKKDNC